MQANMPPPAYDSNPGPETTPQSAAPNPSPSNAAKRSALNPMQKKAITILLIGETGTGKTSFMSLLVNLFQGNGPLELTEKNDPTKETGLGRSHSQTAQPTLYTITTADNTKIQILDTPGLADTRGIDQDNKHKAAINAAIKKHITTIDAVLIMANGTVERLGAATDYTLNVITSMFPYSIIDNIGFIFTNSDPLTWNFEMDSLQPQLRGSPYWLIQNPIALQKNYQRHQQGRASNSTLDAWRRKLQGSYNETVETLNDWLKWLDERKIQPTKEINDLYQTSATIEAHIEATLSAITRATEKYTIWEKIQSDLKNTKTQKSALENLKREQTAAVWVRRQTQNHNTICIAPNCYSNCHHPCYLDLFPGYQEIAEGCTAFSGRPEPRGASTRCNQCPHTAEHHRHCHFYNIQEPREMDPGTREALKNATTLEQRLEIGREATKSELEKIKVDMDRAQAEIRRLVDEYNKISLTKNFAGHINSAIQMLQYRRDELKSKPNSSEQLKLVDETIEKFKLKLRVLQKEQENNNQGLFGWARSFPWSS